MTNQIKYAAGLIALAVLYYAGAELSLVLAVAPANVAPFWIPNAFLLLALLVVRPAHWWRCLAAIVPPMLLIAGRLDIHWLRELGFIAANGVEVMAAAWLIRRIAGNAFRLASLRDVLVLFGAALVASALGACLGAVVARIGAADMPFAAVWCTWWFGDLLGLVIVGAPLMAGWFADWRSEDPAQPRRWLEFVALLLVVDILAAAFFVFDMAPVTRNPALLYLMLIPLVWCGLRLCMPLAAAVLLFLAFIAAIGTAMDRGLFGAYTAAYNMLQMQIYLAVSATMTLILAGMMADRRAAEALLRRSEERARAILNAVPDLMFRINREGVFIDFESSPWSETLAVAPERFMGRKVGEVLPRELAARIVACVRRALETDAIQVLEYTLPVPLPVGLSRDFEARIIRCGADEVFAMVRDVTQHRRAEKDMHIALTKYKTLFTAFPLGISVADAAGRIVEANPKSETLLGIGLEEHKRRTIDGKEWRIVRSDGSPMPPEAYPSVRAQQEGRLIENVRMGIVKGGGQTTWINVSAAPLPLEEHSVVVTYGDVTAQVEAERGLAMRDRALASVANGVLICDPRKADTPLVYCNAAFETMTGYRQDEVLGRNCRFLQGADRDQPGLIELREALAAGRGAVVELRNYRKDGALFWNRLHVSPMSDATGEVALFVGILDDITEQKRAQRDMERSSEQLRALTVRLEGLREQERTRISREIHDELGQMLTGIKMDLRWIEHRLDAFGDDRRVNPILDKLVGAQELVDSTAETVQRIAAELRPGILDKLGLPMAIEYEANEFTRRTGIPCRVATSADEPALSAEVATAFFRIFQEALTNVTRHAGASEVDVDLRVEAGECRLEVRDNGKGIDPAEMAKPTSLGLLGMQERARLRGGSVSFAAREGGGTVVRVRIPIRNAGEEAS